MLYQRASLADVNLAFQNLYSTLIIKYGQNKVKATSAIFDYPLFMYRYCNYNAEITHEFAEFAVEYSMWIARPSWCTEICRSFSKLIFKTEGRRL